MPDRIDDPLILEKDREHVAFVLAEKAGAVVECPHCKGWARGEATTDDVLAHWAPDPRPGALFATADDLRRQLDALLADMCLNPCCELSK